MFLRKYVRITTKFTTTFKKSFQIGLECYFQESVHNEYVMQVVNAHSVPILKCQNLLTEFLLLLLLSFFFVAVVVVVKIGYLRNI